MTHAAAPDPRTEITITSAGRWSRCEGRYRGAPFLALLADPDADTRLLPLLERRGLHHSTPSEDATFALAALGTPDQRDLRCVFLSNGAHAHIYPAGPEAPTLVLLHALVGNLHNWLPVMEGLRGEVRLIAVDLPGHGRSASRLPGPGARVGAQVVDWLEDALAELGVTDAHLVGHSLGGRVAAYYASARPEAVRSLTLLAPALRPALTGLRGLAARAASLVSILRDRAGAKWVARLVFFDMLVVQSQRNQRLVTYALQDMLHDQRLQGYDGLRAALAWLRARPDDRDIDWAALGGRVPVQALYGAADRYCPLRAHPGLAVGGVQVTELPGIGHLVPLEAPEAVLSTLRRQLGLAL
ncbi:MAG TPA: alpha/beta fold hydrolase [Mycobacteriales bacterium]|nr:alpha/beta fold hydrolase [Mycobacteriales bacterium]